MTTDRPAAPERPVLYVVVCAAAPATEIDRLLRYAGEQGWDVWAIATAAAVEYLVDPAAIERLTGHPVRTGYRMADEPGALPRAAAVLVAPATYNTINKWAAGVADSFPLSTLAELTGARVPIVVLPFVNTAFAANAVFQRSIETLRAEGVQVLIGPDGFQPHPPRTGEDQLAQFPWRRAVDALAGAGAG